jgi:hypothetical protein
MINLILDHCGLIERAGSRLAVLVRVTHYSRFLIMSPLENARPVDFDGSYNRI